MPEPLASPAAEPLTRDEAKAFLRIDHDVEDHLIDALVTAARRTVEAQTGRVLITQTWRFARDAWPLSGVIAAPVSPLREILSATVALAGGAVAAVPAGALVLKADRAPSLIHCDLTRLPAPGVPVDGIIITVRAGYGDAAADVPPDLVQAVRLVLAHFHEQRDGSGDALRLPGNVAALIAPYRVVRL